MCLNSRKAMLFLFVGRVLIGVLRLSCRLEVRRKILLKTLRA
jgi:hypothetical protein